VWDLAFQKCIGTFGEQTVNKISDFVLIGEIGLLVVGGSNQKKLSLFRVHNGSEEEGGFKLVGCGTLVKESGSRVLEMTYDRKRQLLMVLSADNQIEVFKVNVSKPDTILKKLVRREKKSQLKKRTHKELVSDEEQNGEPVTRTVDKESLQQKI
jgi:hypothetical protein